MEVTHSRHPQGSKKVFIDRYGKCVGLLTDLEALANRRRIDVLRHSTNVTATLDERICRKV